MLDHAAAERDEPAVGTSAQHGRRPLRQDREAQRVRKGAVVARAHHGRERIDLPQDRRAVEPDKRRPYQRCERVIHLAVYLRRASLDLDPADREQRRLAREHVPAEREGEHAEADRERSPRWRGPHEPGSRLQPRPAHPPRQRHGLRARHGPRETSLCGHRSKFVAGAAPPTGRAARARRETRPRARAGPRTARERGAGPRSSGPGRRPWSRRRCSR